MNALLIRTYYAAGITRMPQVYLLTHTDCAIQNTETPRKKFKEKPAHDTFLSILL